MSKVCWLPEPEPHDYPAAASYLSLLMSGDRIATITAQWRAGEVVTYKAKDLLRAARLGLLPRDNPHVASDLTQIEGQVPLSPVLLVRGDAAHGIAMEIADGYHRVCASYLSDENTDIPCLIGGTDGT